MSGKNGNGTRLKIDANRDTPEVAGAWRAPGHLMIIGGADRLDPEARLAIACNDKVGIPATSGNQGFGLSRKIHPLVRRMKRKCRPPKPIPSGE